MKVLVTGIGCVSAIGTNVNDHLPPKGKTVYLEGKMTDNGWQVCVKDEGIGFDEEAVRHAAERLWRGEKSRRTDGHHGLGLWSAAQAIRAHKGELVLGNWEEGGEVLVRF